MFITALFIIARTWKQPRCPSADEWIRKPWYIYTMEYYSAIKKNTFESVLMRWMKLDLFSKADFRKNLLNWVNCAKEIAGKFHSSKSIESHILFFLYIWESGVFPFLTLFSTYALDPISSQHLWSLAPSIPSSLCMWSLISSFLPFPFF